jgi:antitoxin component YwqK of YwqJK toxin-antitoxin module
VNDITRLVDETSDIPLCVDPRSEWIPDGPCVAYRDKGGLLLEVVYAYGVAHGPYRDYWSNGTVACEGQYANGVQAGEWRYYDRDGSLREIIHFQDGVEVRA